MFASRYTFQKIFRCYTSIVQYSSINTVENVLHFKPKFTEEEQRKILRIVNQENTEELSKFDVSRGRIKNLEIWRSKNGPFQTLSDILEVEGLGEKVLERLCKSIILNKTIENHVKSNNVNKKQLVTPALDNQILNKLESAVGIHSCSTGISWAKINKGTNEINDWNFQDFSFLPKKMLPNETYNLATSIIQQLPDADIYVMEATPTLSPQSPQANKVLPTYNQHLELTSMLMALINSSTKHGRLDKEIEKSDLSFELGPNKVYYLRAFVSARLFKTLVGNERVSSGAIITKLLDGNSDLPCSPVTAGEKIRLGFSEQSGVHKDLLGQALMLIVSFMNLCVYNNPVSLQVLNRGRRNNSEK